MVGYELAEPSGWTSAVIRFAVADGAHFGSVLLRGNCPRCDQAMDVLVPVRATDVAVADVEAAVAQGVEAPSRVVQVTVRDAFEPFELTALCNCHNDHDGRPDDVPDGCGAFGNIRVSYVGADRIRLRPGAPGASEDARWQRLADELPFETLPRVRSAAAKWAATIGSITGVFGIVSLIKGPEEIAKLPDPWNDWVIFLVGSALVFATFALSLAASAAQGKTSRLIPSGEAVRSLYVDGTADAVSNLRMSKWATILAVISLGAAILITWDQTPSAPELQSSVLVVEDVSGNRTVTCGTLRGSTSSSLLLRLPNATQDSTIPIGNVVAIAPVVSCTG